MFKIVSNLDRPLEDKRLTGVEPETLGKERAAPARTAARGPLKPVMCVKLKLKLKTNSYSAIKSEDSEAIDGGTTRLSSQGGGSMVCV